MSNRRDFIGRLALGSLALPRIINHTIAAEPQRVDDERASWVGMLTRVAEPVLANLATNQLKARMPVDGAKGPAKERRAVSHLEALGRTLGGVAPWLQAPGITGSEEELRAKFASLARHALTNAVDPDAADHLNFVEATQNLVDTAFLAVSFARARRELWEKLDRPVRDRFVRALESTRKFKPRQNNWLLFSAMVEAFLASSGAIWKPEPIEAAIKAHEDWYKGDGAYGDGPDFHWDYYNSYVIHPLLIEVLDLINSVSSRWNSFREKVIHRSRRFAAVQERLIAPDGSYPPLGRSITYRCGAFHHLAMMALRRDLPREITPAQVRGALAAVIQRTLGSPNTFDQDGWLRVGLAGHQPSLAEGYITTGSLYLCTFAFLPLGLDPSDEFWSAPAADWTSRKIWNGVDLPPDHAA
jgi:hypothetical protein